MEKKRRRGGGGGGGGARGRSNATAPLPRFLCARPCFRGRGALTSAAGDGGVQARALGDADLGGLLGAGRVDAHSLQQVGVGGAAPEGHTHTQGNQSGCSQVFPSTTIKCDTI